ncbi:MAG: ATP synthase F1 subunit epsilon [Anaerolineae bacterium]|nr:ATP synthase F1 subunit epsilon [Anaerolineae bacterium]
MAADESLVIGEQPEQPPEERLQLHLVVVTGDRIVYDGRVDRVVLPAWSGQITILPHHAALLAALEPGELLVKSGQREEALAVGGGFVEVSDDRVTVLADSAERAEEIDVMRAETARRRAELAMRRYRGRPEYAAAHEALRRSRARLRAARRLGHRRG